MSLNRGHNRLFLASDLQFNVQISRAPETSQHVFQTCHRRVTVLQTGVLSVGNLSTSVSRIMAKRRSPVTGKAHIEFEAIATVRESILECGKAVLQQVHSASACRDGAAAGGRRGGREASGREL